MDETRIARDSFVLGAPAAGTDYVIPALPGPAPLPPTRNDSTKKLAAGGAAFVVGLVGGWLGFSALFGGVSFPDEIAGESRIESEVVDQGVELIQSIVAATGLDIEIDYAFYGSQVSPKYMMFVGEFDQEALDSMAASAGEDVPSSMPVTCSPDRQGAACLWVEDYTLVGLYGWGASPEALNPTAQQLSTETP